VDAEKVAGACIRPRDPRPTAKASPKANGRLSRTGTQRAVRNSTAGVRLAVVKSVVAASFFKHVRALYATDNENHHTKERFMHEASEFLHYELRCVACPVVPLRFLARVRMCRETARW
jgi:hypothetical protein